jgi:hypothetical protein
MPVVNGKKYAYTPAGKAAAKKAAKKSKTKSKK